MIYEGLDGCLIDDVLNNVLSFKEMPNMNEISHGKSFVNDKYD